MVRAPRHPTLLQRPKVVTGAEGDLQAFRHCPRQSVACGPSGQRSQNSRQNEHEALSWRLLLVEHVEPRRPFWAVGPSRLTDEIGESLVQSTTTFWSFSKVA
mmetsp:Transcript_50465/g.110054  ORF Transcript_50465/g.110054 Transcript_50465/m.110054 type:complete len:102 (-) Transcript_50465:3-308(-)